MPVIESAEVIHKETRLEALVGIRAQVRHVAVEARALLGGDREDA